jgi:hypothetical protein
MHHSGVIARGLVCIALAMAAGGCAPLNPTQKQASQLPSARLPPDAVVLDIAFVKLPTVDLVGYQAIWDAADEQSFPAEVRRELAKNGVRVGIFGQQLPLRLQELLAAPPTPLNNLSEVAAGDVEIGGNRQHLPVRAGHRSVIKASPVYPSLAVLICEDGSVRGHQLADARCNLSLKAHPLGDGRVKLGLTPEIEHGETKTRWAGSEGMMIHQTAQERLVLDRLRFEAVIAPGQWLLVSTTAEIKGLGEHFFAQSAGGAVQRRALLIRYSQTQFDDLFAPEQTSARLTTPGE